MHHEFGDLSVTDSDRTSWINIEAVYRIELKGEPERLMKCGLDNHMMLWHGSRTSNLVSILSKGLLIAPREAPSSGSLFNKVRRKYNIALVLIKSIPRKY